MAQSTLIIANSGSGKSTSIRNLDPKQTFIINPANKTLPFKGWKKNYTLISKENKSGNMSNVCSANGIIKCMKHVNDNMPHIKNLIIDDWQYMSAFEYFDRAQEKGYDKFTQIATNLAAVARLPRELRDDLYIFFMTHSEEIDVNGVKFVKAKTVGKMIDNSLTLEGLFSTVLFGVVKKLDDGTIEYGFETQTNGENSCKSPMGMFEKSFIPNDLQYVIDCIQSYEND
jgi:hypothetical protein